MAVGAVALETEDCVDEMLEQSRAGELAVFGNVTNEHDGDTGGFGEVDEFCAAAAELRDAARCGGDICAVDHLHRVDHEDARHDASGLLDDAGEVGVVEEEERRRGERRESGCSFHLFRAFRSCRADSVRCVQSRRSHSSRADANLLCAFFTAHVENFVASGCPGERGLEEQRAFADAGLAADEDGAARNESGGEGFSIGVQRDAQCAIELVDAGWDSLDGAMGNAVLKDLVEGFGLERVALRCVGDGFGASGLASALGEVFEFGDFAPRGGQCFVGIFFGAGVVGGFFEAVPRVAVRALAHPAGLRCAAASADVETLELWHIQGYTAR